MQLGQFSSTIVEVQNDEENDDSLHHEPQNSRSPSPERLDPPPPAEQFCLLNIRQQFVYVKPILNAIIEGRYSPIRDRHENFMRGGRYRQSTVDLASLRGRVDPGDVERLQEIIRKAFADNGGVDDQQNSLLSSSTAQPPIIPDSTPTGVNDVNSLGESPSKDSLMTDDQDMKYASPPLTPRLLTSPAPQTPPSLPLSTTEVCLVLMRIALL